MSSLKIYIASQYRNKTLMQTIASDLEDMGHIVTSEWLEEPEDPNVQIEDLDDETLRTYAAADLENIDDSDMLVLFRNDEEGLVRGGMLVEFGYALAKGKDIVVVDTKTTIFDFLPEVRVMTELEFMSWMERVAGNKNWHLSTSKKIDWDGTYTVPKKDYSVNWNDLKETLKDIEKAQEKMKDATIAFPDYVYNMWENLFVGVSDLEKEFKPSRKLNTSRKWQGIAISGKAGSGKSYCGEFFAKHLGHPWHIEAFANPLKLEWAYNHFGESCLLDIPDDNVLNIVNILKSEDAVRKSLIEWGKKRREQDPEYWIKQLRYMDHAIVTDMRFKNEFKVLKNSGFLMVRIECLPDALRNRGHEIINDESETDLDDVSEWNVIIDNNGTLEELNEKLLNIIGLIQGE